MVSHCVFVVHFRSSDIFKILSTGLTVNIHVSTKTCVTGNNVMQHKAVGTCTNKYKHHITGQKINIWEIEKIKVFDVIEQVRRGKWTLAGLVSEI